MKNILIASLLFCFAVINPLQSQSIKQKEASTALITQLLGGRFQLNAKQTNTINAQQAKDLLNQQTQMPPNVQTEIYRQLQVDRSWQGVRTSFETDCGEVQVIISSPEGESDPSAVYVVLPPFNKCAELHRELAPYFFGKELSEDGQTNACISMVCATLPENNTGIEYQCIEVMTILPAETICYAFDDCSPKRPCRQNSRFVNADGFSWQDILLMRTE